MYQRNLQLLATEKFRSKTGMSHELMNDIFHFVERPYDLRSNFSLERKRDFTAYHGLESLSPLFFILLDIQPNSVKNSAFLKEVKTKINAKIAGYCSCSMQ